MNSLPRELLYNITSFCDLSDLPSISLVSHTWNSVSQDLRKGLYCTNELEEQSMWYNYSLLHFIQHESMNGRIRTTFAHKPWPRFGNRKREGECPLQVTDTSVVVSAQATSIGILNRLHEGQRC